MTATNYSAVSSGCDIYDARIALTVTVVALIFLHKDVAYQEEAGDRPQKSGTMSEVVSMPEDQIFQQKLID